MPTVTLHHSPLANHRGQTEIYFREYGAGVPLLHLHGGWGYEIYPFHKQIEAFGEQFRILIPDRTGYGKSSRVENFAIDFHRRAAMETLKFMDALEIERAVLWGHSDGAVIAAMLGADAPDRLHGIILEAFHYYRTKPGSQQFFETMAIQPHQLGERITQTLSAQHGEDYWRELIVMNGQAWLQLADESAHPFADLYDSRLAEVNVPTLFIQGSADPRTEAGEMEAARSQLPKARFHFIENGGHAPHSESRSSAETNRIAEEFLQQFIGKR